MASSPEPSSSSSSPSRPSRHPSSPWSHVVRGDPDAAVSSPALPSTNEIAPPETAEIASCVDDGAGAAKKPAWKRPSDGSIEVGPVMDADSWPALSETAAKPSPKPSFSSDSSKTSDGSAASPPGLTISTSSSKLKSDNGNPSSTPHHPVPARQKSMKRGGGMPANGGGPALPSPPPASAVTPKISQEKQDYPEASPKGQVDKNANNSEHGNRGRNSELQHQAGGDHHYRGYGGNRRGNNGGGYGNRRGGFSYRRSLSSKYVHLPQQQHGMPPYIMPPSPVAPPFTGPPPQGRPFGSPIFFPEMPSPVTYYVAAPPFIAHPAASAALYYPQMDHHRAKILKQIDYYFSADNLCKDIFLRQNMDEQGWVPLSLIANFNKVKQLTNSIQFIKETVHFSVVVEVQDEKIRRRNDWMNWILPQPKNLTDAASALLSPATSNVDSLAIHFQTVGLEGAHDSSIKGSTRGEIVLSRSASGNLSNQVQVVADLQVDGTNQVSGHADMSRFKPAGSLVRSDSL
ncbi:la-related protein 1C-like isoform X1 [Typha angustifolia]|uniref:la-related protein 1C-like isoform X1 n=1 Tax=Typha angustifolia TaxID=59011 RepID=UPI003C30DAA0